jgi:hypothetical protein
MSTTENQPQIEVVKPPLIVEPGAIVEKIHPVPGTPDMPDLDSQDTMATYLIERMLPEESATKTRLVLTPTRHTIPGIARVPDGFKEVSRWRKTSEWLIRPRTAAAIVIGSMALFNGVGNRSTVDGAADYVGHEIYRTFVPVRDKHIIDHHTVKVPGKVKHLSQTTSSGDTVQSTTISPLITEQFVARIEQAEKNGANIAKLTITGNTSNEWGGDSSIGTLNGPNIQLGYARAEAAVSQLSEEGLTIKSSILEIGQDEHVITAEEKVTLLADANEAGFQTISEAISAVDNDQPVPPSLVKKIKQFFTDIKDRGVSMDATMVYPGHEKTVTKTTVTTVPGKDHAPEVPKPHWDWFIPMLPIRRRERYSKVAQTHKWQFKPSMQLYRPDIISEEEDQAWLRIRPEAVKNDGTLVDDAWAFTRKYEHLLRDDRIADIIRADFKNALGEDKSLRVVFVDKTPSKETVEAFETLLRRFASMQDGKLADRVTGILIYPSENAGTDHDDPRRIAMGIDKQSPEECLGTYTYPLKLVELHMPTTWSPDEVTEMLSEFNGPSWVLSHEVAGHATDRNDKPQTLRRVIARGIPNAHVIDGDAREYKMAPLQKVLRKLTLKPRQPNTAEEINYDISYPVQDSAGNIVTVRATVAEDDPRLAHASHSTIIGHQPSRYSGQNSSEHYAETAASVTTNIAIPYGETGRTVPELQTDDGQTAQFATGYHPDSRGQRLVTDSIGANPGSSPATFETPVEVTIRHLNPANDSLLRKELLRTRSIRTLRPEEMVAILARVARRRK